MKSLKCIPYVLGYNNVIFVGGRKKKDKWCNVQEVMSGLLIRKERKEKLISSKFGEC